MKVVIPAAGLGTRLLPATKEQPKEMLPIFTRIAGGQIGLKPLLHLIFEQLYDMGFRQFCFVIGKGKRAIKDHFTPAHDYVTMLENRNKSGLAEELREFYQKIEKSTITWIDQPQPKGFGDAVLKALPFVGNEPMLVHAGDAYIMTDDNQHLTNLIKLHERRDVAAAFLVKEVDDPKRHGIVEAEEIDGGLIVKKVVEKPEKPSTKLAIMPVYVFRPIIFEALKETPSGKDNEIQLTDAIQKLIDWGSEVCALELGPDAVRLDVGTIETYWEALSVSREIATRTQRYHLKRDSFWCSN